MIDIQEITKRQIQAHYAQIEQQCRSLIPPHLLEQRDVRAIAAWMKEHDIHLVTVQDLSTQRIADVYKTHINYPQYLDGFQNNS